MDTKRQRTGAAPAEEVTIPPLTLVGPGTIYFADSYSHWTKGHLHPDTWHCITRHYQQQDHTPQMLIATLQQRITPDALDLTLRAAHVILDVQSKDPHCVALEFVPKSIIEYLLAAPLTADQLIAMRDQIVSPDGPLTLKQPSWHWDQAYLHMYRAR